MSGAEIDPAWGDTSCPQPGNGASLERGVKSSAPDPFKMWSASLPFRWSERDGLMAEPPENVRPWNGRALTREEFLGALRVITNELKESNNPGLAAQAAFEYLSEVAW